MGGVDCLVAFTYWNPVERRTRPLPDGVRVRVWESDPVSPHDLLGEGRTAGGRGQLDLPIADRDETEAEVFFELVTEGAAIDLAHEVLVPEGARGDAASRGGALLPLPVRWTSRDKYAVDYRRGLFRVGPEHETLGRPDAPLVFRVWFDCFLRFVYWNERQQRYVGLPEGVTEGGDAFELGPSEAGVGTDPAHPYFPRLEPFADGVPVRVIDTTPGARTWVHQELLGLIDSADREVLVENPYFSSREVANHLIEAAQRGVRVVYVFPDGHNDSYDFLYAARLKYEALLLAGVEVHEYGNHMTHAKVAIIDDVTVIGSANLNHAGLFNHYEVAAVIHDRATTARFRRDMFERDLAASRRIHLADLPELLNVNAAGRWWCRNIVDTWF